MVQCSQSLINEEPSIIKVYVTPDSKQFPSENSTKFKTYLIDSISQTLHDAPKKKRKDMAEAVLTKNCEIHRKKSVAKLRTFPSHICTLSMFISQNLLTF